LIPGRQSWPANKGLRALVCGTAKCCELPATSPAKTTLFAGRPTKAEALIPAKAAQSLRYLAGKNHAFCRLPNEGRALIPAKAAQPTFAQ
jgi:hypothetical protein